MVHCEEVDQDPPPAASPKEAGSATAMPEQESVPVPAKAPSDPAPKVEASAKEASAKAGSTSNGVISTPGAPSSTWFIGCVALAFVAAIVQQGEVLGGGSPRAWIDELFEEHVVPPPIAHDTTCTIQFCQS